MSKSKSKIQSGRPENNECSWYNALSRFVKSLTDVTADLNKVSPVKFLEEPCHENHMLKANIEALRQRNLESKK